MEENNSFTVNNLLICTVREVSTNSLATFSHGLFYIGLPGLAVQTMYTV